MYMYKGSIFKLENQRCRDGVMNDFVSRCMHLLVSFLFFFFMM